MPDIMKNMISTFIIAVMISVLFSSGSFAMHELFNQMDKDQDGRIALEEFSDDMEHYAFEKIDADNDSAISKEEWNNITDVKEAESHRKLFGEIDSNKDRKVTFGEFSDYSKDNSNIEKAFMGFDKDSNHYLYPDDISSRPVFRMITIEFGKKPPKVKK